MSKQLMVVCSNYKNQVKDQIKVVLKQGYDLTFILYVSKIQNIGSTIYKMHIIYLWKNAFENNYLVPYVLNVQIVILLMMFL